jgi:hypothetical protein
VNAYAFDNGKDFYLEDGLIHAIERQGKDALGRLVELGASGDNKALDKAVDAFLSMRTRAAAEAIPMLLENPHLSINQRAALLHSYVNYQLEPPLSAVPLLEYLSQHATEALDVKQAGLEAIAVSGPLKEEKARTLLLSLLEQNKETALRLPFIRAVGEARLTKAAGTLVRWLEDSACPAGERMAIVLALRGLESKEGVPALQELLKTAREARAEPLVLQAEALRTLAALDPAAARTTAETVLEVKDLALREAAVEVLSADAAGARKVGRLFLDGKLPSELRPQIIEALRKHRDKDAEAARMLAEVMKNGRP